jgi:hypothetical protein
VVVVVASSHGRYGYCDKLGHDKDCCDVVLLEYVRGILGLGWLGSPLVLGLTRDRSRLLRGQVSLAWESNKPLRIRRYINLIKQELRRKTLPSCPAMGKALALAALVTTTTSSVNSTRGYCSTPAGAASLSSLLPTDT